MCRVTEGSLCSLRGCFIHREHSFLDASHAAFVESSTMWPYACLSDCKVMVKCVESDGKGIVTHVSVQSHHQPVRPDREGCHPSCVSCMRQRQAADWVHALPTVLVRWVRLFHSLPPDTTCCHSCHSPFSLHLCRMKQRQAADWVHALPTVLGRWDRFHSLPPAATPGTFMCCHAAFMGVSFVCVPSPGCTRV